ncbi:MAG: ribulokinase [candidate division KSB1 bacterium]|nr:ribulokinase [candidate division KSB1 bacterium]
MGDRRCSLGIDFGTESARALLVDVATGEEVATEVFVYPHGVMDRELPDGQKLEPDWALQHPQDYLDALHEAIPAVLRTAGIRAEQVVGIGIDFTSCTMLPIDGTGQPLCFRPELQSRPHAWVKLWKHHAAEPEANRLKEIAEQRGEVWLRYYGGKISSEWLIPKIMQILDEDPEMYVLADQFLEAGDWIVLQLTGELKRSSCHAGYKAIWQKGIGYPSREFFRALDPRLENLVEEKLRGEVVPIGRKAGDLTERMARATGLQPGTPVAVSVIDAHVGVPATTVDGPGKMALIMGTSTCHMVVAEKRLPIEGISGVVEDGILPGYFGYEAGQAAVGDIFAWFVRNAVPPRYHEEAERRGISLHALLEEKAAALKPGQSGLLALDWWNGCRSVLIDYDLSGLLIGPTLTTTPEEVYRALIEATAFGTRVIVETFQRGGVEVEEFYACGGLTRNRMLMQIYADVLGREIKVARSEFAGALGAAMYGAVAAGSQAGGYDSIQQAIPAMAHLRDESFRPVPEHRKIYDRLFQEYVKLYDFFGRGGSQVMKVLRRLRSA